MYSKPVIFVVISVLVVVLIYSSSTFDVLAETVFSETSCTSERLDGSYSCCYQTYDDRTGATISTYCKECQVTNPGYGTSATCTDYKKETLEEPPTTPPSASSVIPGGGVLSQDGGVLQQQPPTDQGAAAPRTVVPPTTPTCAPGTILDPDINECVLENPLELCTDGSIPQPNGGCPPLPPTIATDEEQAPGEEPEEPTAEEGKPSEENGSEETIN